MGLLPAMRQVGTWREIGHCDIAQQRASTEAVRGWLDRQTAFSPTPRMPRPVVLACGPNDWHTIGLESLAMLLRHHGWSCRVLGARVPVPTLASAVTACDAAAVIVVSQLASGRRMAVESIYAVHGLDLPVFYTGHAFTTGKSRAAVPGRYLGTRIQDASDQVVAALTGIGTDLPAGGQS